MRLERLLNLDVNENQIKKNASVKSQGKPSGEENSLKGKTKGSKFERVYEAEFSNPPKNKFKKGEEDNKVVGDRVKTSVRKEVRTRVDSKEKQEVESNIGKSKLKIKVVEKEVTPNKREVIVKGKKSPEPYIDKGKVRGKEELNIEVKKVTDNLMEYKVATSSVTETKEVQNILTDKKMGDWVKDIKTELDKYYKYQFESPSKINVTLKSGDETLRLTAVQSGKNIELNILSTGENIKDKFDVAFREVKAEYRERNIEVSVRQERDSDEEERDREEKDERERRKRKHRRESR